MEWIKHRKFTFLCAAVLATVIAWIDLRPSSSSFGNGGISPLLTSTTARPPSYALHVLFIGNSYTFVHDIPRQVADIASSDPGNPIQLTIQSVTRGGIGLKELWDDGNAVRIIRARHWDYVVLQEQSFWAMFPQSTEAMRDYAGRFNAEIRQAGAKPLLYLTWVRKSGTSWYTDPKTAFLESPDYMMQRFTSLTHAMGKELAAPIVEVGLYWMRALKEQPGIELYEADGSHPGIAGSYLAALVFYKALTGRDVTKTGFHPPGMTDASTEQIKSLVARPLSIQ